MYINNLMLQIEINIIHRFIKAEMRLSKKPGFKIWAAELCESIKFLYDTKRLLKGLKDNVIFAVKDYFY